MPELPEVELVVRALRKLITGRNIIAAELLRERLSPEETAKTFAAKLRDTKIDSITRRGKHILIHLGSRQTLLVHLRMSGRFMLLPLEKENPKFTHAVFYLDDESRLVFQDQRHFGLMKVIETENLAEAKELAKLAPEPFSDEFSTEYFFGALSKSSRNIKEFILDQSKVCGIGNIYASEALFLSKINPRKPALAISKKKAAALHEKIREVLAESIAHGSTMNIDPENIEGSYYGGNYEGKWRVYDQEDEPCMNCGSKINRITQGSRSTYFCGKCQR